MLYTAQFRYPGADRMDITVKSGANGPGKAFIPTWPMVMDWKNGKITDAQYTTLYMNILAKQTYALDQLAVEATVRDVVLVCYCPPATFCHRILLARHLEDNYHVDYMGELLGPNFSKRK